LTGLTRIYRKQETKSNERSNSVNSVQEPKIDNTFDRINRIYRKQETKSNERSNSVNSVQEPKKDNTFDRIYRIYRIKKSPLALTEGIIGCDQQSPSFAKGV
jgi:hypothetical protein